jgi:hypothetical protein
MADNPSGQSCATCSFYIGGDCRAAKPSQGSNLPGLWGKPDPDDWCVEWNVWSGRSPAAAGAVFSSGTLAPTGGNDGDFYARYTLFGMVSITALSILQKQSGAWVVIQTIL